MFKFSFVLALSAFIYLHSSGFTNHAVDTHKTENNQPMKVPLLTLQQISEAFDAGVAAGATHMLIVWDTWDFNNSYNFILYSYQGEDVNTLIKHHDAPGFYRVSAVFALHRDFNEQLKGKRWNTEYP